METGYTPAITAPPEGMTLGMKITRSVYRSYFEGKLWFKRNPLVRCLRPPLTGREIDEIVLADDHPPEVKTVLSRPS